MAMSGWMPRAESYVSSQTRAVLRGTQLVGGKVSLEDVTVQQALGFTA